MIEYSSFERHMAYFLNSMPKTKLVVKKVYQFMFYMIFGLFKERSSCISKFKAVDDGVSNLIDFSCESFFGYYDKSPINRTNEYIIFHKTTLSTKMLPDCKIPVLIVLLDIKKNIIKHVANSYTYNWQQGTKLQWISDYEFIFNSIDDENNYCSHIVDALSCSIIKTIPFAIYDVYENYALSVCYDRLDALRPDYGYQNHRDIAFDLGDLDNDGIFKIDLVNKTKELIVSLKRLKNFDSNDLISENTEVIHKVNHLMISPDGLNFIFLHRFFVNGRKFDRLFICDLYGENLRLINDNHMVSHCCWYGVNKIVSYMRRFDSGDKYYLIDIEKMKIEDLGIDSYALFGDGHPSVFNDHLLFDTYPDKSRRKQLVLFNFLTKETNIIGEFYESFQFYGQTRCDLHPKWSFDGKLIFFDSVHTGKRRLYCVESGL